MLAVDAREIMEAVPVVVTGPVRRMKMDERLVRKVAPLQEMAETLGWETATEPQTLDGLEGVQLTGVRTDRHPDAREGVTFGFTVAFAINPDTGRAIALRFDGNPKAVFVMVVEDGSGKFWYGPLSAAERALDDPQGWTGVVIPPPVCAECSEPLEDGCCTNPYCVNWRMADEFDAAMAKDFPPRSEGA